jgi:hypothetical protein
VAAPGDHYRKRTNGTRDAALFFLMAIKMFISRHGRALWPFQRRNDDVARRHRASRGRGGWLALGRIQSGSISSPNSPGLDCGMRAAQATNSSFPMNNAQDLDQLLRYAVTPALKRKVVMSELGPRRA